jgi:hypothetical protein
LPLISLTDHDTADGVNEMKREAAALGIECFPGIELSAFSCAEIHILGYNVDISDKNFLRRLDFIKEQRQSRVASIISKLNSLNIEISQEEVERAAGGSSSPGRLHIAKALVNKKKFSSVTEVFDRVLGCGKAAYVSEYRLTPREAIEIIAAAGGKAVLAHPFLIDINKQNLLPLIRSLMLYGLNGIEAGYYAHNSFETDFLKALAKKLNLIATGGSDYHGKTRQSEIYGYEISEEDYIRLKE